MHELDCAVSIAYFCPLLEVCWIKRMKNQNQRLFILRAALIFGFWIGAQLEVRQSSWLLFLKKILFLIVKKIEVAHKMKKSFWSWPDFDPTWSLWWLSYLQWVSDGSPSHSHATKIENNNQFVPVNTNPKEFKKVQKLVRKPSLREASAKVNVFRWKRVVDWVGYMQGQSQR